MRAFFSDPITTATTVIAVATVINLIISSLLWRATKRTADVTKNIFDAANRPFLFPVLDAVWDRERRRFNFRELDDLVHEAVVIVFNESLCPLERGGVDDAMCHCVD